MNGIDEIINKIISDAEAIASSLTAESNARLEEMQNQAALSSEERRLSYERQLSDYKKEALRRRNTVADLDIKKELLGKKKEIIDKVYSLALEKLCALPEKEYLSLIEKLIDQNASDGDAVVISKNDKDKITKTFIQAVAKKKNISLTVSDAFGNFSGGIILSSEKIDKNLSFDTELKDLSEENLSKLSAILFGE